MHEVFSLGVKHSSIRALLAMVAMEDLELHQLDVKTAFLHGELEEEIYMKQPRVLKLMEKKIMGTAQFHLVILKLPLKLHRCFSSILR